MAKDWEKLGGEKGERIKSSKIERVFKLGAVGAGVAASSIAGKLRSMVTGNDGDDLSNLYRKNADRMADTLGQLKGASMKIGQMISADPEGLPPEFAEQLARLQRDAPPMTWTTVKDVIEGALDRPMDVVFRQFDPEPVGAASIGQVHRGILDSGEEVAIKIQYPGVMDALESDLDTLKGMLVWGRPFIEKQKLDNYFAEIRDILLMEADYEQEAHNLQRFNELLADRTEYVVPKPFLEYTRKNVLVMEYMHGEKLDVALQKMEQQERNDLLFRWLSLFVWMFHEVNELHADPHPGNFLLQDDGRLALLDFGCVKHFEAELADGMLEVVRTCWDDDPERALEIYAELGFGNQDFDPRTIDLDMLGEYHDIVLAPFLSDGPFQFEGWQPAIEGKKFMLSHPSMLQLTPPPESLMYFRLLSGIKGLLGKLDARLELRELVEETIERRGL